MKGNSELDLLNKFNYDIFKLSSTEINFSRDKSNIKFSLDDIKIILKEIPDKHRKIIPRIYVVNYFCQNNPETKGRHLAKLSYVILYPNAFSELKRVLIHEIGHVIWDKKLTSQERIQFYQAMLKDIPTTLKINNELKRHIFVLENFANCYQFFLCNIFDSKKYPNIYRFISSLF
jgi:hypothetical protein